MESFKDNADRTWQMAINVDAIKRVRSICNLDLLEAVEGTVIPKLKADPVLLVDVIYAVCEPAAQLAGCSPADFGKAMTGDAIENATDAFLKELINFFPRARRELIRLAVRKMDEVQQAAVEKVTAEIQAMSASELMQRALGDSSGNSPAPSALTQAT